MGPITFFDGAGGGQSWAVKHIENKMRVASTPYLYDVAQEFVDNSYALHRFGKNADVDIAAIGETIWTPGGHANYLTAAEEVYNVSLDAADAGTVLTDTTATAGTATTVTDTGSTFVTDGIAAGDIVLNSTQHDYGYVVSATETQVTVICWTYGTIPVAGDDIRVVTPASTGAAVIELTGLDGSYNATSDFIVLNGVADVKASTLFLRIFTITVLLAGSVGSNVGAINVEDATSTTLIAQVAVGMNEAEMAMWTVPAGYALYLTSFYASENAGSSCAIYPFQRSRGGIWTPIAGSISAKSNNYHHRLEAPVRVEEKVDIQLRGFADADNAKIYAGFHGWYELV